MITERHPVFESKEWRGCFIRISIESPIHQNMYQSQLYVDARDLEILQHLKPIGPDADHWALIEYDAKRKRAEDMVEILAKKVSMDICRHIMDDQE